MNNKKFMKKKNFRITQMMRKWNAKNLYAEQG